jgi:tripartite motif-containing protein 71
MKTCLTVLVIGAALVFVGGALLRFALVNGGLGSASFNSPQGLAVSSRDNLYIVDSGNSRIVEVTPADKKLAVWNTNPKQYGDGDQPYSMLVDRRGNVYVWAQGCHADLSGSCPPVHVRQEVFSARGRLLVQVPVNTFAASDLRGNVYTCANRWPRGLAVRRLTAATCRTDAWGPYPGAFTVVDAHRNVIARDSSSFAIVRVSPTGAVSTLGTPGVNGVGGLALGPLDDIYAIDSKYVPGSGSSRDRIVKLSPDGQTTLRAFPSLENLSGVAVGRDGAVYVAERDANRVDKLSAEGKILARWSQPRD